MGSHGVVLSILPRPVLIVLRIQGVNIIFICLKIDNFYIKADY